MCVSLKLNNMIWLLLMFLLLTTRGTGINVDVFPVGNSLMDSAYLRPGEDETRDSNIPGDVARGSDIFGRWDLLFSFLGQKCHSVRKVC